MVTKKNRSNPAWIHTHINDPFVKLSKREDYRARAVYKLKEIDEAAQLIKPNHCVVDLGAAPGSWSQYVARKIKNGAGRVIALDIAEMVPIAGVDFICGDFRETKVVDVLQQLLAGRKLDVVLSDMAPNLSGISITDAARMEHLVELAIEFANAHLKENGALLVKCFHGPGYDAIVQKFKSTFKKVKGFKPAASRAKSSENFLLGVGLKLT